ncbi:MAG: alpha-glucosidase C-terminal domain-containing protein [Balneolales bacterium]|nr:alpha-glucosidase C-terminal domain-containing protein [Balneolales bacterium]
MRFTKLLFVITSFFLLISCSIENQNQYAKDGASPADVPEWAQQAIWYQIFVERFRDGDSLNNPTLETIKGSWPHDKPDSWQPTRWTQDWYAMEDWALESGKEFYRTVQMRRYGGDLQGVIDKLDYLQDLGINAIYFNPLNDSPSLHKYDARSYHHIDVNFGPDPVGDRALIAAEDPADPSSWVWTSADRLFLELLDEARKRGIRVVMDYSWNHTGSTFWAWQHILEHQQDSPFADWYQIDSFDSDTSSFSYPGWAGVPELPQFRRYDSVEEFEHGDLIPGNFHPDLVAHIYAVTERWLAPDGDVSRGVDGFRLDVAELIPVDFWRDYRAFVRGINPEAYLVGELWWADWPEKLMDPTEWLQGDIFDAAMNYRWYRPTRQWLGGAQPLLENPSDYVHHLDSVSAGLREEVLRAQMNLTASHDTPRFSTSIYNQGINKYQVNPRENPNYKLHRPDERTWRDMKLILVQQFTWIGAPHIWMGDEFGMWGADDPDNRKPLIWPDLEFDDETHHPFGLEKPADRVEADLDWHGFYRQLIHLRRDNPVFSLGTISYLLADDKRNVLIYERTLDDDYALVIINNSSQPADIDLSLPAEITSLSDALGENVITFTIEENQLKATILPKTAAVLLR